MEKGAALAAPRIRLRTDFLVGARNSVRSDAFIKRNESAPMFHRQRKQTGVCDLAGAGNPPPFDGTVNLLLISAKLVVLIPALG